MTNPLAGDTVNPTKSTTGDLSTFASGESLGTQCTTRRKRRRLEPFSANAEVPEKAQRREEELRTEDVYAPLPLQTPNLRNDTHTETNRQDIEDVAKDERDITCYTKTRCYRDANQRSFSKSPTDERTETQQLQREAWLANTRKKKHEQQQQESRRRDEASRLRKTIQWLEEGGRRLREDLASARTELHEERRAAKIARRETEAAIREARATEAAKYQMIIAELKARLARSSPIDGTNVTCQPSSAASRLEFMKEEHHKREMSALKKRLAETEGTIRRLKWESLNLQTKFACKAGSSASCPEVRRLENEVRNVRASNEKLEEKLRIAQEAERARTAELRIQHDNHEAELSSLRKSLRTETIKMMDELRLKSREIEKLSKLTRTDLPRKRRKTAPKDETTMRKLRENERSEPIRSASRMEKKFLSEDTHTMDSYIQEEDRSITEIEVERLRELALEQQEVIEILRQAVKEKERKLEQLSNKRRKEEFYRQWLELEPVVEVDDEEDHEEGDSALSSAPSSLSPQPGCGQWQGNGVTREAYEAVLVEMEELQSRLSNERQELATARNQVRDLEKALVKEARCENRHREVNTISEKLRMAEEREATLLVELSELREQNELLEFRLLELEETSARRGSPDHTADSGIVSPEPMHATKDYLNKQRNRAVATVIPYTNSTNLNTRPESPNPRKPPLSLQESGIFEEDVEDEEESEVQLASRSTQTEVPGGELLQEVQRLQELQARIQERVTNPVLCPIDQSKSNTSLDFDMSDESIDRLSSYQERIRELEDRLEAREDEIEARHREKRVSKQREEDLLDENYRLTERVYWLENELKNLEQVTERIVDEKNEEMPSECLQEFSVDEKMPDVCLTEDNKMEDQSDESAESLETEETKPETSCEDKSCEKAVQTTELPSVQTCPSCQNCGAMSDEHSLMIIEEMGKEAKEGEDDTGDESSKDTDDVDSGRGSLTRSFSSVSQVFVVPEEESPATVSMDPVVSLGESEKKQSAFRGKQPQVCSHCAIDRSRKYETGSLKKPLETAVIRGTKENYPNPQAENEIPALRNLLQPIKATACRLKQLSRPDERIGDNPCTYCAHRIDTKSDPKEESDWLCNAGPICEECGIRMRETSRNTVLNSPCNWIVQENQGRSAYCGLRQKEYRKQGKCPNMADGSGERRTISGTTSSSGPSMKSHGTQCATDMCLARDCYNEYQKSLLIRFANRKPCDRSASKGVESTEVVWPGSVKLSRNTNKDKSGQKSGSRTTGDKVYCCDCLDPMGSGKESTLGQRMKNKSTQTLDGETKGKLCFKCCSICYKTVSRTPVICGHQGTEQDITTLCYQKDGTSMSAPFTSANTSTNTFPVKQNQATEQSAHVSKSETAIIKSTVATVEETFSESREEKIIGDMKTMSKIETTVTCFTQHIQEVTQEVTEITELADEEEKLCPCGCLYFQEGVSSTCSCGCEASSESLLNDALGESKNQSMKSKDPSMKLRDESMKTIGTMKSGRSKGSHPRSATSAKSSKMPSQKSTVTRCNGDIVDSNATSRTNEISRPTSAPNRKNVVLDYDNELEALLQNISKYKKENEDLRNLIAQCQCLGDNVEELRKQPPIRGTSSGLIAAIEILQTKCSNKDGMIAALAGALRGSKNLENVSHNLLAPCLQYIHLDFDLCAIYVNLRKMLLSMAMQNEQPTVTQSKVSSYEQVTASQEIPKPRNFKVVQEICKCILVSWDIPDDISNVTGYNITVNGLLVTCVSSPTRTDAVLGHVSTSQSLEIAICAVAMNDQFSKPVTILYETTSD